MLARFKHLNLFWRAVCRSIVKHPSLTNKYYGKLKMLARTNAVAYFDLQCLNLLH
jgi:hypothetical protein